MYFLIYRFKRRKSSDYILARSVKKDKDEIIQLLAEYRDKHGFNAPEDKLYIKKV